MLGSFQFEIVLVAALSALTSLADPIRVASLNPIVSDVVRQVGGEHVQVVDLMPTDSNPHSFYPSPEHLKEATASQIVFAAGKGLEQYLEEFRQSLGTDVPIFDVGGAVPSLKITAGETFVCCPTHAFGSVDPHWWQSIRNMQRAAEAIAKQLGELDPSRKDLFNAQAKQYSERLDGLHKWARMQIARIPRADRELTTAHAAFGYLCTELGLRSITVQGLSTEDDPQPTYLKDVIKMLRAEKVKAVFPEHGANPTLIAGLVKETGVTVGGGLFSDNLPASDRTYEAMVRHNIDVIVAALAPKEE